EVTDEDGNTESQVISVTVTADNDPTVFGGDTSGTGAEDAAAITGDLDATDADGLTDPIFTIELGDGASNGTATINSADGTWSYIPAANFNGTDAFTVSVTDDAGNVETQEITLTVTPVADLTAVDDAFTTDEDTALTDSVAGNDSTISGGTLSYAIATGASNGSVLMAGDGSFTYTPSADFNGSDSFTYTVVDAASGESSTQNVG
ncbi:Ig-like domain-containing protein, partial [Rhodopirellula europaea]